MPTIPLLVLAAVLALVGAAAGVYSGRVVPLFRAYEDDDADTGTAEGAGPATASDASAPVVPARPEAVGAAAAPADPATAAAARDTSATAPEAAPAPAGESEPAGPPPPTCPVCAAEVAWPKWAPLPGRFVLRGRCPTCDSAVRAPLVVPALAAALLAAVAFTGAGRGPAEIAALAFFGLWAVLLGTVDARVKRLPNRLLFPAYPIALALLAVAALTTEGGIGRLVTGFIGMAGLAAFYFVLWFIYPAGMGWGDVKMAGLLGLFLGWETLGGVFSGTFLAFLVSSVFGLTLMLAGKATRKSEIPLGPFMLLGAFVVILFGDPLPLVLG